MFSIFVLFLLTIAFTQAQQRPAPSGYISIHDPSSIVYEDASQAYYQFGTGLLQDEFLSSHVSKDGYTWEKGNPIFTEAPAWVAVNVTKGITTFWAPDIIYMNNLWHLYYAVSTFGSQVSCIGVAVTKSLDPNNPSYLWKDQGFPVICSSTSTPYNTIDPHVFIDQNTNRIWMNYGSYWNGIFIVELTGNPIVGQTQGTPINIAQHSDKNRDIEASWVQADANNNFWLFVNYGQCCEGVNSTYNIRMGMSKNTPLGPYIDADGVPMLQSGGTLLMTTDGRQIGPGQIGFPTGGPSSGPAGNASAPIVSYHYYDLNSNPPGKPILGQAEFDWSTDNGFPTIRLRE
jgi:arabinan endo-1,5-alpha-L-arabinosidase